MDKWRIEKLSEESFGMWKLQLEVLLIQKDLSIRLEGKSKKPIGMLDEDWDKLDWKAATTIILSLSSNGFFNDSTKKIVKGLWDRLPDKCEMASASNKVFFMMKLYNLKIKELVLSQII